MCDMVKSNLSQSYKIKGETTDEAFQKQCFLSEKEKKKKTKKHKRSPLT